jgi:hypothetical protein
VDIDLGIKSNSYIIGFWTGATAGLKMSVSVETPFQSSKDDLLSK